MTRDGSLSNRSVQKLLRGLVSASLVCGASTALARAPATPTHVPTDPSAPDFAHRVLQAVDDLYRGGSSHARIAMSVTTKHWKRTLEMESWTLGADRSLIRILQPKKERGTATLMVARDLFTYLSKTDRTIKISGTMMGGSWMGSHFTNDDLVRSNRFSEDFAASLTGQGMVDGTKIYQFTLTPKESAAVVWGKIVISIRASDLMPIAQVFHDEDGVAIKSLTFHDFRTVQGRTVPFSMRMLPLDKPGESTEIRYKELDYAVQLDDAFFSVQNLRTL